MPSLEKSIPGDPRQLAATPLHYFVQCTLHIAHRTLHSTHCRVHTKNTTLNVTNWTLHTTVQANHLFRPLSVLSVTVAMSKFTI